MQTFRLEQSGVTPLSPIMPFYKLIQGDCLEILPTLESKSVDLILADPPYNIGKAEWDTIPDYINWCLSWLKECRRTLKDNGSLYLFHNDMLQMAELITAIKNNTEFAFKCLITWEKYQTNKQYYGREVIQGVNSSGLRCYYPMSEYIAFYTLQCENESVLPKNHFDAFLPIKLYLRIEKEKSGLTNKKLNLLFSDFYKKVGCRDRSVIEHYFGDGQWIFPTKEIYENVLQSTGFFQKPYCDLLKEFENIRYPFNVSEKDVTRTWLFTPAEKAGHETPKPIPLLKRILNYSTTKGSVVLDPFAGSGSTIKACKDLERSCIAIEKSLKYTQKIKSQIMNQTELLVFNSSETKRENP
jgi:site-specific DNA-methyltransferase (adenine-specific)